MERLRNILALLFVLNHSLFSITGSTAVKIVVKNVRLRVFLNLVIFSSLFVSAVLIDHSRNVVHRWPIAVVDRSRKERGIVSLPGFHGACDA